MTSTMTPPPGAEEGQAPPLEDMPAEGIASGPAPSLRPAANSYADMQTQDAIAQAIATGVVATPSTSTGWQDLYSRYSSASARDALNAEPRVGGISSGAAPFVTAMSHVGGTAPEALTGSTDLNSFLAALKQHESGGNYTAYNAKGGASGAYQFIQSTWSNAAKAAGFGQYANGPASDAPPAVQDAVAGNMAQGYFSHYGNWADVAQAWYDPALVGQNNVVPYPSAGNTETMGQYAQSVLGSMPKPGSPEDFAVSPVAGGSSSAIDYARGQLGTPYVWGGEQAGKGFDCSGLVQAAYAKAGVKLPRTAQEQYDSTTKLPDGAAPQPGDLVFFGSGPSGVSHVGIYVGNGQMIDAPHTGANVRVENANWADYVGATRPTDTNGQTMLPPAAQAQPGQATQEDTSGAYQAALNQVRIGLRG